jgi:hypothetical protein
MPKRVNTADAVLPSYLSEGTHMILHSAYATLRRLGLVANHAAFSTGYLNMSALYYDHLICSRRPAALNALLSLFMRVKAVSDAFATKPHLAPQSAELAALASAIWAELEWRSCSLLARGSRGGAMPARAVLAARATPH